VGVVQLGLQTTTARRVTTAAGDHERTGLAVASLRLTCGLALALGVALLALSPLMRWLLRLDDLAPVLLVAACAVPLTALGGPAGVLQGERRWRPLALVYLAAGVPRLVIGLVVLALAPSPTTALAAVLLGALVPLAVAAVALRSLPADVRAAGPDAARGTPARSLLPEVTAGISILGAFLALSTVDVIVARAVLDAHDAGLYAAALILTKAVLFLPQFVVVVAFPAFAAPAERARALRRSLALVLALGVGATGGAALLPDLALAFVGGREYAEVAGRLWVFAILGTVLATIQLVVYAGLARRSAGVGRILVVGTTALVVVGATWARGRGVDGLLSVVLTVDLVVLTALGVLAWRRSRSR